MRSLVVAAPELERRPTDVARPFSQQLSARSKPESDYIARGSEALSNEQAVVNARPCSQAVFALVERRVASDAVAVWPGTREGIRDAVRSGEIGKDRRRLRWRVAWRPGRAAIGRQIRANLAAELPIWSVGAQERLAWQHVVYDDMAFGNITGDGNTSRYRPVFGAIMGRPDMRLPIRQRAEIRSVAISLRERWSIPVVWGQFE